MGSSAVTTKSGFSLMEMLLVIAIIGLLIGAVALLVGRSFNISRSEFEQVRIVDDARLESGRITNAVRNAQDTNGTSWWISGGPEKLEMYTNVDGNADIEHVRYFVDGTSLKRGVTKSGGSEQVTTLVTSLQNGVEGLQANPVFTFDSYVGDVPQTVGLHFDIDVNPNISPGVAKVETQVVLPRQNNFSAETPTPPPCPTGSDCNTVQLCPLPTTSTATCQALYALTAGSPAGVYRYNTGTTWVQVGSLMGVSKVTASLTYVQSDGTSVFLAGGNNGHVYKYTGVNQWSDLGQAGSTGPVYSLAYYAQKVYAGNGDGGHVYRNDGGGVWADVGQPGGATTTHVTALTVYNGQLYAGVGTTPAIYRYNTTTSGWDNVSGTLAASGDVLAFGTNYDGALYAGLSAGGGVARSLGGNTWEAAGTPGGTTGSPDIATLVPFSYQVKEDTWNVLNGLFAGRRAATSNMYQYNGGTVWSAVGQTDTSSQLNAAVVYRGSLVAGMGGGTATAYQYDSYNSLSSRNWFSLGSLSGQTAITKLAVQACDPTDCPTGYTSNGTTCN